MKQGIIIYFRIRSRWRWKYEKTENNNNSETVRCTETGLSTIFQTRTACPRIRKFFSKRGKIILNRYLVKYWNRTWYESGSSMVSKSQSKRKTTQKRSWSSKKLGKWLLNEFQLRWLNITVSRCEFYVSSFYLCYISHLLQWNSSEIKSL